MSRGNETLSLFYPSVRHVPTEKNVYPPQKEAKIFFMNRYPVVFCVGTPRVKGDSLGPKVGDLLLSRYNVPAYVYGTSSHPVTGVNFSSYVRHLETFHPSSPVIAVDACLGKKDDVGKIKCTVNGLRAGSALKKNLGVVGSVSFLGIVAESGENNYLSLSRAAEKDVDKIASVIAEKIFLFCLKIRSGQSDAAFLPVKK